jgi:D-sedoheptulose 7-phosphate isomerase
MNTTLLEVVNNQINESIKTKLAVLEVLSAPIAKTGEILAQALLQGNKILCCGNGGSAADAQHFSAELLGRYIKERRALPAIALTTDTSTLTAVGNDYGYEHVFARQIHALAKPGDVLIAISTSGNSANIIAAIEAARECGMQIIALTGKSGGKIAGFLQEHEQHVCVPAQITSYIQESHIMIIHCWCEIIDRHF